MPMLAFKCLCGNEFEKIMPAHQALYKWCKHCDKLTMWEDSDNIGQKVCFTCMGNQHLAPVPAADRLHVAESIQEACPACGKMADHVLKIEKRGFHKGTGALANDSSVAFRFNYLAPDV